MKIISIDELGSIDAKKECFIIKNAFPKTSCDKIVTYLQHKLSSTRPNEKFEGNNWHYTVDKKNTYFHSFILNELSKTSSPELNSAYKKLFELYANLGEKIQGQFEDLYGNTDATDVKTINPLVFVYPAGTGTFDWHQHPPEFQSFQLLMNLTQPNLDYSGGHTHVKINAELTDIFDSNFEKGDVFSFPYDRWHKVDPIFPGQGELKARISLLMPLHPRKGLSTNYKPS
jgi:hypothetical protein